MWVLAWAKFRLQYLQQSYYVEFSSLSSNRRWMDIWKIRWCFGLKNACLLHSSSKVVMRLYHEFSDETRWRFRGHISQVRWVLKKNISNRNKKKKLKSTNRRESETSTQNGRVYRSLKNRGKNRKIEVRWWSVRKKCLFPSRPKHKRKNYKNKHGLSRNTFWKNEKKNSVVYIRKLMIKVVLTIATESIRP